MKLKCGDYVRLDRNQGINKIVDEEDGMYELENWYWDSWGEEKICVTENELEEDLIKHSSNIIDLIEKDDYINGCRVYEVEEQGVTTYQQTECSGIDYNWIHKSEIRDIVTKELFNSIKYEVK